MNLTNLQETHNKAQHWYPYLWEHLDSMEKILKEYEEKYPGRAEEIQERREKLKRLRNCSDAFGGLLCDVQQVIKQEIR